MTSSKVRVELRDRLNKLDTTWVEWGKLAVLTNTDIGTLNLICAKKEKIIIRNSLVGVAKCILSGFEYPFSDLPLKLGQVNFITEGVVKYRLEKWR